MIKAKGKKKVPKPYSKYDEIKKLERKLKRKADILTKEEKMKILENIDFLRKLPIPIED